MRGTNTGPLRGNLPTGISVALPGANFVVREGGRIRSVRGYFDRSDFAEQLGMQVIVSSYSVGPVSFGNSVYMQLDKRTKPTAFNLTSLSVQSDGEAQEVRGYSQRILREMARMPGAIDVLPARVGDRRPTAIAWEDTESPQQMLRDNAHEEAVGRFFGSDFTAGGMTSVWKSERINAMWVRCAACESVEDYELSGETCRCRQQLPEPPPLLVRSPAVINRTAFRDIVPVPTRTNYPWLIRVASV